ncbi:polysaccharide pyruvyl transferase family protein [Bradyrhizobium sp. BR 1432]|uniref:polysaccharide pyruvyl transferase family protein n=1 Tax=Bradyrhizobium sp. BR 1432 TaxID=3447966 RepID=UPI003EE73A22
MGSFADASKAVRCGDATDGTELRTMAETPMKDSRTLIAEMQDEIEKVIGPHLEGVENFALVDFPNHSNVGDSAIWLGEETYLQKKLGRAPSYVCTYDTWSKEEFERAVPVGPILIHGGGNFGDLWPSHQEFRLRLLSEFPDRQIIQLPQTIHFSSKASLKRAAEIINSHKKFRILVRDVQSLNIATTEFTAPVDLCPDMAFCLGAQSSSAAVTRKLLLAAPNRSREGGAQAFSDAPKLCSCRGLAHRTTRLGKEVVCQGAARDGAPLAQGHDAVGARRAHSVVSPAGVEPCSPWNEAGWIVGLRDHGPASHAYLLRVAECAALGP